MKVSGSRWIKELISLGNLALKLLNFSTELCFDNGNIMFEVWIDALERGYFEGSSKNIMDILNI